MPTRMREAAFCLGPDETLQQCKAELFDRYGRRATSRRKFSIRDFDAARIRFATCGQRRTAGPAGWFWREFGALPLTCC